jgi:hypothetical protein
MIDMRTKFFAFASILVLLVVPAAPEDLRYVPLWLFVTYVILTLVCAADSISRNSK